MKVSALIARLYALPQDADVQIIYDGEARLDASSVYEARGGAVIITQAGQSVYSTESRPADAPTEDEQSDWQAPSTQTP
jgi:hypothetical protein